jgi:uncharacterized protein YejL (UPF0352 family)
LAGITALFARHDRRAAAAILVAHRTRFGRSRNLPTDALAALEHFAAPAVITLVIGDLIVNGLVDLHCPGVESGGSLVMFGNVSCNILASDIEPWQFLERIEAGRSIFR